MKAMILDKTSDLETSRRPLRLAEYPAPLPGPGQILIKIAACGVCRTELDQIEGRIKPPKLPVIPGHQPVGIVAETGKGCIKFKPGDRAGATWIYSSCGRCSFCINGLDNLCESFKATGCHHDGGYAEYMVIGEKSAHKIPESLGNLTGCAPLMCSGVVGYRSLKLTCMENGRTLGLYGFGSANHLVLQMANYFFPDSLKFVVTRNPEERVLAKKLGADWSGDIEDDTPQKLDCAIDTTPAWKPVLSALGNLKSGGRLVLNLICKEQTDKNILLNIDYEKHLWAEKEIKSVANITVKDGEEFLKTASEMKIKPEITCYELEQANDALIDLKSGKSTGSKVLKIIP